jgi:ribosomal protein L24E
MSLPIAEGDEAGAGFDGFEGHVVSYCQIILYVQYMHACTTHARGKMMANKRTSVFVPPALKKRLEKLDQKQKPRPIGWTWQLVRMAEKGIDLEEAAPK